LTRQPPWIGIEQFSKEILVVSGEEDLAPEGHLGDFWLFGLGFLSAAFVAFALFMTISRLQLFSLRKVFKIKLGEEAKHEIWRPLSTSEELDELHELSDLEIGDLAESQLLRDGD